jgi:hypothetical protein
MSFLPIEQPSTTLPELGEHWLSFGSCDFPFFGAGCSDFGEADFRF